MRMYSIDRDDQGVQVVPIATLERIIMILFICGIILGWYLTKAYGKKIDSVLRSFTKEDE
nr:hypothetical protein [uncultured Mediterranean phage uvMED]